VLAVPDPRHGGEDRERGEREEDGKREFHAPMIGRDPQDLLCAA
jgi:hypothetical protein